MKPLEFRIETASLKLSAQEAAWDSKIYEVPVVQITDIAVRNVKGAAVDFRSYESWGRDEQIGITSCRLAHDRLKESIFLESRAFRFVEMVLHPMLGSLQSRVFPEDNLIIMSASEADLPALKRIAEQSFSFERYHVDPRLNPKRGDERYAQWVCNSLDHPSQQLLKVSDEERLLALFLIELRADRSAYWHLTAIAPQWQGQGYGRRVWLTMLNYCKSQGCHSVATTISARNTPVLNLYSQLQFRFTPPEMTFHWVRGAE